MTQGHTIETRREDVHVEVRLDGVVVASSDRPVLLDETGIPTVHYLPKEDVQAELRPIGLRTHCPFKGDASYWTIETENGTYDGIAWSYEEPKEGAEDIRGLVAFFADRAEVVAEAS